MKCRSLDIIIVCLILMQHLGISQLKRADEGLREEELQYAKKYDEAFEGYKYSN